MLIKTCGNRIGRPPDNLNFLFFKWVTAFFPFIFGLFKQTIHFLQQINAKNVNVHPAYGPGIWTHSRLPLPLDQGSRPLNFMFGNTFKEWDAISNDF